MLVRLVFHHLRSRRPIAVVVLVLLIVQVAASMMLPTLVAAIINDGVMVGDTAEIIRLGWIMFALSAVQFAGAVGATRGAARIASGVGRDIRHDVYHRVQRMSVAEVSRFGAPSLITRSTNDAQQVQMLVVMAFQLMVIAPVMMIGGIIMAMRQDIGLSWIFAVVIPLMAVVMVFVIRYTQPRFTKIQGKLDRINTLMREQISGVRVLRAFTRQKTTRTTFRTASYDLTSLQLSIGRMFAILFPVLQLIIMLSQVAIVWFGGQRIDAGDSEIGSLIAFINYIMIIFVSLMMSAMVIMIIPRASVSAGRITEVLNTEPAIRAPNQPVDFDNTPPGLPVQFGKVSFTYEGADEPALHDLNLTLQPGTTTAVIGSTGSGKTTFVNLIPRFLDPTRGTVRIGGVDLRDADPHEVRRRVGLVPQQAYLFSGTIRSTLVLGRKDLSDDDVWRALDVAQAADFVGDLREKLDATVSQGGQNFSGGQRQRLAIARALVHGGQVFVFDDAFSALDMATDARLRAALPSLTGGATSLVVAQRVSSVKQADRILVLDRGNVVGDGTHTALVDDNATYQQIVASQLSAEEAR